MLILKLHAYSKSKKNTHKKNFKIIKILKKEMKFVLISTANICKNKKLRLG